MIKITKAEWADIDCGLRPMAEWLREQAARDPIQANKDKSNAWADEIDALRAKIGRDGSLAAKEGVEPVVEAPGCGGCGGKP